jgi:hypothetical protein
MQCGRRVWGGVLDTRGRRDVGAGYGAGVLGVDRRLGGGGGVRGVVGGSEYW